MLGLITTHSCGWFVVSVWLASQSGSRVHRFISAAYRPIDRPTDSAAAGTEGSSVLSRVSLLEAHLSVARGSSVLSRVSLFEARLSVARGSSVRSSWLVCPLACLGVGGSSVRSSWLVCPLACLAVRGSSVPSS